MPGHVKLGRTLLAGMLGGMAGALAMDLFQHHLWTPRSGTEEDEINENIARLISRHVFHRGLNRAERKNAGTALHYLVGAGMGAAYGTATQLAPVLGRGAGAPFGIAVWLAGDELAAPALSVANPRRFRLARRANELAAHLLYAVTLDAVQRALQRDAGPLGRSAPSTKPSGKSRASKRAVTLARRAPANFRN
jgi:uncharacterized membrane protein YagU involved in acid resistance